MRGRAPADDRRRPGADRGGVVGRRARPRVPAPRGADADPDPRRRRGLSRPEMGPRRHPRRARRPRSRAPREADPGRVQQDGPARRPRGLAAIPGVPARRRGAAVAISADGGDGLDSLRAAVSALLPDADGPGRAAGAGGRRRPPARGGERRVRGRAEEEAPTGSRAGASSASSPRPTSTTRSRPSGSSGSWSRTGIDGALRKAGIRPGDPVRIGGTELEWDPPEDDR